MNTKEAWALVGGLSKPSKMPAGQLVYLPKNARLATN